MEIRIRVKTGAKRESVTPLPDGRLEIWVKEKPQAGAANERVLKLVAAYYQRPAGKVRIIKGLHSPTKLLSLGQR